MPELPEVETTRRGIEPHVVGRRISRLLVHEKRLRWPVDLSLVAAVAGRAIRRAGRRAKYLLIETESVPMTASCQCRPLRLAWPVRHRSWRPSSPRRLQDWSAAPFPWPSGSTSQ